MKKTISKELEGLTKPKQKDDLKQASDSEKDSGGSLLVEIMNKPLDVALMAYKNRSIALTELPKKFQEYPNPQEENIGLVLH
ncbi:hypothetical protein GOP47_0005447 [Adiantum capillus-veneris]|uniref:Uncharacterized protein n=1 Tax=Adiantum capillus-veneris TaxID=13818 RepID=A0A9D4V6A1_ADICA|nr:hypothetical protein GOP47_0005447 [Adiantum capillus-veneris]